MYFIKLDHIKTGEGLPKMKLKISDLSIQESYFVGHCQFEDKEYLLNIQNQSGGKLIKFPFEWDEDIVDIRISGKNTQVQDELKFKGKSEWIEIYSNTITNYLADHQQGPEWLDVLSIQ
jgi:hypothetical protein